MAKRFLVDLDLNTNQLQNAVIQTASADPSGVTGRIYFNNISNLLKVYDGSAWQSLTTGTSGTSAVSLTGDVTGNASVVAGVITVNTTIGANSVALGTDTTGDYVASLTASTGVSITGTTGEGGIPVIAIGQPVATTDGVSFASLTTTGDVAVNGGDITTTAGTGALFNTNATTVNVAGAATTVSIGSATGTTTVNNNLTVAGNLTVSGSVTTLNTESLIVEDNVVILNSNVTGEPSTDAGLEVERGSSTNVSILWNETDDRWTLTNNGSTYHAIARKTSHDITGNSSSAAFALAHNLGTRDVTVNVYANGSPYDTVEVDIERTDSNTVTVRFAVAPTTGTNYRAVIVG